MVFSSLTFLFLFLPIFLSVYYLLPKKLKNFWIFVSSIWFYYCGQKQYVWLMILVIAVSYLSAILINRADENKKKNYPGNNSYHIFNNTFLFQIYKFYY